MVSGVNPGAVPPPGSQGIQGAQDSGKEASKAIQDAANALRTDMNDLTDESESFISGIKTNAKNEASANTHQARQEAQIGKPGAGEELFAAAIGAQEEADEVKKKKRKKQQDIEDKMLEMLELEDQINMDGLSEEEKEEFQTFFQRAKTIKHKQAQIKRNDQEIDILEKKLADQQAREGEN